MNEVCRYELCMETDFRWVNIFIITKKIGTLLWIDRSMTNYLLVSIHWLYCLRRRFCRAFFAEMSCLFRGEMLCVKRLTGVLNEVSIQITGAHGCVFMPLESDARTVK